MKKIFVPAILALGLFAVSCEDKLDIPQKGVTSTIEYYSSDAEAASALANMYAQYIENVCGTEGIDNPEQVILNYAADDVLAAGSGFTDHDAFRIFDEFQYDEEKEEYVSVADEDIGLQSGTKQMPLYFKADNMLEFANREEIRKYWIENVQG